MNVLTVNTGSSSVRLALFAAESGSVGAAASRKLKAGEDDPEECVRRFLAEHDSVVCSIVSHRVVHGGTRFVRSCLIDDAVAQEIQRLSVLAPLHNPPALRWVEACQSVLGNDVRQVAVFDTAFFSALPDVAALYALPEDICRRHSIKRYGFHGIAHRAMLGRWKELRPDLRRGGRLISLQLGSGCSVAAVQSGTPVDTSMGFSPLEGLMMSTRCGDLDPGVLLYLQKSAGFSVDELDTLLNTSSGLFGVSARSGDMQTLLGADDDAARFAIEMFCYRARKYVGAYMAALGGADGIVFGGGVGENAPLIREKILSGMQWCGMELDRRVNGDTIGTEGRISASPGRVDIRVIPVDEAAVLAREAVAVLEEFS